MQTPSDTTFRVFDWNRLGPDGKPRAACTLQKRCKSSISRPPPRPRRSRNQTASNPTPRVWSPRLFRKTASASANTPSNPSPKPRVWIILDGQGVIHCEAAGPAAFTRGDTLLLPANMTNARLNTVTTCTLLEAKLPAGAL